MVTAVRTAAAATSAALDGSSTRIGTAPTARASASWSTKKLDRGSVTSAATTTTGVRLLAASVMPVIALVSPEPWCTVTAAGRSVVRAYASAIVAAPPSCRAATNRAPAATIALVTWKFPEPTTPKTWSIPAATSARPTASATVAASSGTVSARPEPPRAPARPSR